MIRKYTAYSWDLPAELLQSHQEGRDIRPLKSELERISDMPEGYDKERAAKAFYELAAQLPPRDDYAYVEPDALDDIRAARPVPYSRANRSPIAPDIEKIHGAWLGRCCGCLLGKPFEGCMRERITGYFKATDNYPIRAYAKYNQYPEARDKYAFTDAWKAKSMVDLVNCMPADDDLNYTVLALCVMEQHGWDFTADNIADAWLGRLPANQTYTAERVAYRNLLMGYDPPESAIIANPYREWIGAQIRADLYGYVTPGDPERAAELAYRDAIVSHTKNGVYGAMAVAAMLAEAARTNDMERVIRAGIAQIPALSRMAEALQMALCWRAEAIGWEKALDRVHELYDERVKHYWCLATANMLIVAIALCYGDMDLGKTIGIAVSAGFDTDCNGATAGSILGMALGASALDAAWIAPLNDELHTGLVGEARLRISDAAKRTLAVAKSRARSEGDMVREGDIDA